MRLISPDRVEHWEETQPAYPGADKPSDKFAMNIKFIRVLLTDATDIVAVHTDMPCPFVPESGMAQPLVLEFKASYNKGAEYVRNNFNIEPEIVNVRSR